ncbi:hypothetical protein [Paraburkholderia phenoliruptrix]|uniref:hypothetical protein n=1 Tax=Paraburkholderia phenoliruptrix TaxID=252970 RepID=UPI001C6E0096|nr:hypothetical protein [Paraburkholderia phenoliruptrix]MBW9102254.1 hypothetical protein [Paraburkholderia phenoliruptrix]MBW9127474.1 hypothetical protein [Paraburkholderia ginsengiterrae]
MKISSAEFLATVAIVSSAAVLQLRQHAQPDENLATSAPQSVEVAPSSCERARDGVIPASCEAAREQRPAEHAPPQRGAARIWV